MRLVQRKAASANDPIRNDPQEVMVFPERRADGEIQHMIETYAVRVVSMVRIQDGNHSGQVIVVFEEALPEYAR